MIVQNKIGFLTLLLLFLSGSCFADSLILKNGREIKGEIIHSDSENVQIEYFVTPTIKDQKIFPKDEISRIVVMPDDEKAFLALGSRATPPTVLDTSFYDVLIEKKLPDFFNLYPYSRHITELREDMRSLSVERDRVIAGDRRIDGLWITAAEIVANPYEIGAKIQFSEIKRLAESNDPVATLKAYELLEKNYPGSSVMPDALELIPSQLDQLQGKLSEALANYDILAKKRQAWIDSAPADQAREIKAAIDNENSTASSAIAKALKDGTKFFPIFPNSKDSLDQLQALLLSEKGRMKLLQVSAMRESLSDARDASRLIDGGSFKDAQNQLDAASKLWPANVAILSVRQKLDAAMQAHKAAIPTPSPKR